MKNLKTLSLSFVFSISMAAAQAENSGAYDAGYTFGYYAGLLLPYIIAVAIVYTIYRVIRRKRGAKA